MIFLSVTPILAQKGITNLDLKVLAQDAALYSCLLMQPCEELECTNEYIHSIDIARTESKFRQFFELAIQNNVELAITPEYSCPWGIVEELVTRQIFPQEKNLWIIGCESIKARDLSKLMNRLKDITWVTDEKLISQNEKNNHFFDPVCYLFRTAPTVPGAESKLVMVVQFKTQSMGGKGMEWERDNLILGDHVYVLENAADSTKLVTFVCSDALNAKFDLTRLPHYRNYPYLIIHIQLNNAPKNITFGSYRGKTFDELEDKEFICLNWSRNVIIGPLGRSEYGGSALYVKPEYEKHLDTGDARLNANHQLGLFYTRWKDRHAHIYFFTFDEHVLFYRSTKPSQKAAKPALRRRTGPEMLGLFSWIPSASKWEQSPQDDGFVQMCSSLKNGFSYATLIGLHKTSPLDVERLIYLSVGNATHANWYSPDENKFFRVNDDETVGRMTFTHDPCPEKKKVRLQELQLFGMLENTVIVKTSNLPDAIADLRNNCIVKYREGKHESDFNLNLYPANGDGVPAVGAFIGIDSANASADVLSKMIDLFNTNQYGRRVVVWYIDCHGDIKWKANNEAPSITDNTSTSSLSIRSKEERK